MSGSRNKLATTEITIEFVGKGAPAIATIIVRSSGEHEEREYCDSCVGDKGSAKAIQPPSWHRLRKPVLYFGICTASLCVGFMFAGLAVSVLASPWNALGASAILVVGFQSSMRLIGQIAGNSNLTKS